MKLLFYSSYIIRSVTKEQKQVFGGFKKKSSMKKFRKIIRKASKEERHILGELTGSAFGSSPSTLSDHLVYLRHGSIGQLFHKEYPWKQLVTDVADQVRIDWSKLTKNGRKWKHIPTEEIENAVCAKVFDSVWEKLPPQEKQEIIDEMNQHHEGLSLDGLALTGGAMALAKVGGFGTYLLASTSLGMLTGALGITLPFAVYTGMSVAISTVLGPIGWSALGLASLWHLNQPQWQRLTIAVVYVSMLRQQQKSSKH